MSALTTNEYLQILAVISSPIIAIQVDKILDTRRSSKNRKIEIFKTLMATRGSSLSFEHVGALNRIDLEFSGNRYKKVIDAWKEYFDLLSQQVTPENLAAWSEKTGDYLTTLLYEMALSLNYQNFDRVTIKRNVYAPSGHKQDEAQNKLIKDLLVKVLSGQGSLSMEIDNDDETIEKNQEYMKNQIEIQQLTKEHYLNEKPWNIRVVKDKD
ncbi:DUF6680 family protein [Pedobacter miscanthi]|uniref:DUF6680 family protein n=1 Tax=Pedobacter miscanthi TaxID=2259170 RepID=UPI00292E9C37|nr:DUF6680 family protein [Pedobacter miscanthi]